MKVRWREHEMIFVAILLAIPIIVLLSKMETSTLGMDFSTRFRENGLSFIYWRNVLLPRIGISFLVYFGYLSITLFIVPLIKKISFTDFEKLFTLTILKPILAILVTGYLLALGVNILTYYGRPYLFNYSNYQWLAALGYNGKPLTNLFSGFDRAILFVLLFTVLAGIRELFIWFIERPGEKKEFRVLIINNLVPLLFIWILIPQFLNPLHGEFMDYIAWTIPVLVLYMYQTFWLLPLKENRSWLHRPVLVPLLTATLAGTIFFTAIFSGGAKIIQFLLYWAFLLFIITPLCWALYQQRKDKILQLRNIKAALAKSTSDLQFLRSQINPHFLFNTLNTLYGTALKENSEQTAKGIQMLGDMMRFMLHENHLDFIPMNKEIEYLKNYIALQKLRLPNSPNISIEDNIEDINSNRPVIPMLFIPFVENAFKYGISFREKSWIDITLECTASSIYFEIRNSLPARPEMDPEKNKSGIGLKNVIERLQLLYPGKHEIKTGKEGNEFIAKLIIK